MTTGIAEGVASERARMRNILVTRRDECRRMATQSRQTEAEGMRSHGYILWSVRADTYADSIDRLDLGRWPS